MAESLKEGESASSATDTTRALGGAASSDQVIGDPHDTGSECLDRKDRSLKGCESGSSATDTTKALGFSSSLEEASVDSRDTDLDFFHQKARFDPRVLPGHFARVRGLSDCCRADGKVELHTWIERLERSADAPHVVVKRVRTSRVAANLGKERNERRTFRGGSNRHSEDCLNEIGVYWHLAQQSDLPEYLVKMHTAFHADSDVWLVQEYAEGGDLLSAVKRMHREGLLAMHQVVVWTWQLLQAIRYLHEQFVGHRDVSGENVLLSNGVIKLMDFGQSVLTHSASGVSLRYFSGLGKPYYRPSECYVPPCDVVQVKVPLEARPGSIAFAEVLDSSFMCEVLLPETAVPGRACTAEPWGYTVPPVDVFAAGVLFFIMATGMPPWKKANLEDAHFKWVHTHGVARLVAERRKAIPESIVELMASMMQSDPQRRPSSDQCLEHACFTSMAGTTVPVHHLLAEDCTAGTVDAVSRLWEHLASPAPAAGLGEPALLQGVSGRSLGSAMDWQVPSPSPFGVPGGGFIHEPDDVCRGELPLESFSSEHVARPVPAGKLFELHATTFVVGGPNAAEVANEVLRFLSSIIGAVATKVKHQKFTIKASLNTTTGTCTLKARVYSRSAGKFAVEFQRRSGDSVALNQVFEQALLHFEKQLVDVLPRNLGRDEVDSVFPLPMQDAEEARGSEPAAAKLPVAGRMPKGTRSSLLVPASGHQPFIKRRSTNTSRLIPVASVNPEGVDMLVPAAGSALNAARWRNRSTARAKANSRLAQTTPFISTA